MNILGIGEMDAQERDRWRGMIRKEDNPLPPGHQTRHQLENARPKKKSSLPIHYAASKLPKSRGKLQLPNIVFNFDV